MAKATTKAASLTTLAIGKVEIAVGLFSTVATPGKLETFDTAGPNGGVLKARPIARPVPVGEDVEAPEQPVVGDPLGDMFSQVVTDERVPPGAAVVASSPTIAGPVDGEYGRELVEDGTGEVVAPQDVRRGVRLEDGSFVDCTAQLAEIDETTKLEQMRVVKFVDITRVPRARVQKAYYVGAADEQAPRALRLLFEGLKRSRRGAVVKLTKKSRQSLGIIGWFDGCLMLYELVWSEDFREAPARAQRIAQASVTEQEVASICELIAAMSDSVDALDELADDAIVLRRELKVRAERGEIEAVTADLQARKQDDEVMAQLEASLAAVGV